MEEADSVGDFTVTEAATDLTTETEADSETTETAKREENPLKKKPRSESRSSSSANL